MKRVHSDPTVKHCPDNIKRINTYPNIDQEDTGNASPAAVAAAAAGERSHSVSVPGTDNGDIFTIKFNARSDAISFEVKPEADLESR